MYAMRTRTWKCQISHTIEDPLQKTRLQKTRKIRIGNYINMISLRAAFTKNFRTHVNRPLYLLVYYIIFYLVEWHFHTFGVAP